MRNILTGLLVFSQAAVKVVSLNRPDSGNYQQHFCDESLFAPTSAEEFVDNYDTDYDLARRIGALHSDYCMYRLNYENSVEAERNSRVGKTSDEIRIHERDVYECQGRSPQARSTCTTQAGIAYASTCNQVRIVKAEPESQYEWNRASRNFKPCQTARPTPGK